jgi:hypothetical protein
MQAWAAGVHVGYGQWDVGGNHMSENLAEAPFENVSVEFHRVHFCQGLVESGVGTVAGGIYLVFFIRQRGQTTKMVDCTFTDNVLRAGDQAWAYQVPTSSGLIRYLLVVGLSGT